MAHRNAICLVCRGDLADRLHLCPRCETPQHQDCYEYIGRCSLFGCAPAPAEATGAGAVVWTLLAAPAGNLARGAARRIRDSFSVIGREWGLCLAFLAASVAARSLGDTLGLYLTCAAAHLFLRGLHLRAQGHPLGRVWIQGAAVRAFGILFLLYPLAILTWVSLQILQATASEAVSSLAHLSVHVTSITSPRFDASSGGFPDAAVAFLLHGGLAMLGTGILSFLATVVSWFLLSIPGYSAAEWIGQRGGPEGIRDATDQVPFASLMGVTVPCVTGLLLARFLGTISGLPLLALSLVYLHLSYIDLQRATDPGYMGAGIPPFVPGSRDDCP